jgi:hypothetical protein
MINLAGADIRPQTPISRVAGTVKGVVLDPNEARISNARITIEGSGFEKAISTNELGEYEFEVPSGIYGIRAEVPNYSFQRAAFRVKPRTVTMINIMPVQRILSTGLEVTREGARESVTAAPPPQSENLPFTASGEPLLDVAIEFQQRQMAGEFIEYGKAMLSYDCLTIYARRIRLNKRTFDLDASEGLVVEDGNQRLHGSYARANLRERKVALTLSF